MNRQIASLTQQSGKTATSFAGRTIQRKCDCGNHTLASGECDGCKTKRLELQRRATGSKNEPSEAPPIVHEVLRSAGQPLDEATRGFMEPRFGYDFSQVSVHTDATAAESVRAVNALAYTVGRDIVFGVGQFAPETSPGRSLLAHELTHVVQQSGTIGDNPEALSVSEPDDVAEKQADIVSRTVDDIDHDAQITQYIDITVARQELTDHSPLGGSSRPVFFCSKPVAAGQSHAFFRVGGSAAGNSTFELEHDEYGDHCPCGIQGWPTRDYQEDKESTDARCIPAPGITEDCLLSNWNSYPVGKYCALGPNSNTYARLVAERCGAIGLRPPGRVPGFSDPPPSAGTANPALDARISFLPGACQTIDCNDDSCRLIYF
jgi:Domain of unknown function (DUF4157)